MMFRVFSNLIPRTKLKLKGFRGLQPGWHYGSGGPIAPETIELAEDLYETLLLTGLTTTDAFPGAGGEILLTGYYKQHYVGFMIEPNGEISCTYERGGTEQTSADDVTLPNAREWLIKDVARRIWSTSGLYIPGIMITPSADSMTWLSRSPLMEEECRSSTAPVVNRQVA